MSQVMNNVDAAVYSMLWHGYEQSEQECLEREGTREEMTGETTDTEREDWMWMDHEADREEGIQKRVITASLSQPTPIHFTGTSNNSSILRT